MTALVVLALCLGLGVACARWASVPVGTADALNWWVVHVALPALTLALAPTLSLEPALWFLVAPQWAGLAVATLVFGSIGRRRGWPRARTGAAILLAGLGNTSFVGYPLVEALRGEAALPLAVVADQVGAFIALSTGGLAVIAAFSDRGGTAGAGAIGRKLLRFPPLWALVGGLVVGALGGWPSEVTAALLRIGGTLSPLALFSVGLRLRLRIPRATLGPLAWVLSFRLLVWPALAWCVGMLASVPAPILAVGVLQAAMAPMTTVAILAERDGLDGELARATLAVGIGLSLATVTAWNALL